MFNQDTSTLLVDEKQNHQTSLLKSPKNDKVKQLIDDDLEFFQYSNPEGKDLNIPENGLKQFSEDLTPSNLKPKGATQNQ